MYALPIINRDIFYGGSSEGIKIKYNTTYTASLFDVLKNYASLLQKKENTSSLTIASSELHSVDQAIQRIKSMFETNSLYN